VECILKRRNQKKFNNLSLKLRKINKILKKVVKNRRFWVIFSIKKRYCSLGSLDRGTKVGFKMKYNCYMLEIQASKKLIGSWWGDIRVRTWHFENYQETQLTEQTL
jgi:hypothetical protein